MNRDQIPGLGASKSKIDFRTFRHDTTMAIPVITGGYHYLASEILNQHTIGKCTAISLIQNANKALGKKFSDDFQYLLQKKFVDGDWDEGSSIFSAMKIGNKFGFLLAELWTHTTEADSQLPYSEYIAKLQTIPDAEIQRLIALCTDKLAGYAQVPIDAQSLSKAIFDSKAGILTRYEVGKEWFFSYSPQDIDPIKPPKIVISGHAINANYFDFSSLSKFEHANTWGITWDLEGSGNTIHEQYSCTEAWIPYYTQESILIAKKSLLEQLLALLQKLYNKATGIIS